MLLTHSVTGQQVGRLTTGVAVTNTQTDKDTGEPLDFAINGDGFYRRQRSRRRAEASGADATRPWWT